ncbi:MAG: ATP-binding protein [Nitrosopumilus sp.]|nr:PAS domain S-box protein [Nitrososphaerota archaeon]
MLKLSHKISLSISIIIIISTILFVIIDNYETRQFMLENAQNDAIELTRFYVELIKDPMYFQDVAELNKLSEIIMNASLHIESVYIILPNGKIIADGTDGNTLFGTFVDDELRMKIGELNQFSSYRDEKYYIISAPIILNEFIGTLIVGYSIKEIEQIIISDVESFAFFGIIITGVVVVVSFFIGRTITAPLNKIKNAVEQVKHGNFNVVIPTSNDYETNLLATSFRSMLYFIKKSQKELQQLLSAIDEADIIAKTDKNGNITYVNKKFCEISKYSYNELIGKNHRLLKSDRHPPEFYDDLWDTISSGRIWRGEIQNRAKDGSYYWVKTVIVPQIGYDGKPEEYLAIRTDITNRKLSEKKLEQAFEKIKQNESMIKMQLEEIKISEKQKDEFASMISHELKSPLTPIIGYCDLLKQPELSKDYTDLHLEAIDEISSNAQRLERITMDLLDINKLHMKKLFFHKQNFSLSKFMDSVKKEYSYLTTKKQIQFFVKPVDDQTIYSDEPRLRQVMDNLIRNAIDFVSEDVGKITIDVSTNSADVTFSIQDNGIGIPKEKQKDLFKKFFQVDSTFSRSRGGTGLGLAICKGIIEELGGKIWVKSEVGKGTTFYFQLPINSEKQEINNTQKGVSK